METYNFLGFDIPVDLLNMTGGGVSDFDSIAFGHFEYLKKYIAILPTDNILEVGCGIGRDAIPLSKFLTTGSYKGIDIIGRSIQWCESNIGKKNKNFKFYHFDVKDKLHNPNGEKDLIDYKLPCEDSSIDKIFLWSVFTHMFERDIEIYLKEFQRVLKPSGRVLITCFIVDPSILKEARKVDLTPWSLRFEYSHGDGCFINNLDYPTGAVAFTQDKLLNLVSKAQLTPELPILTGQWWGKEDGLGFGQDVIICKK
jgi:SAM-dependent methyltransferase